MKKPGKAQAPFTTGHSERKDHGALRAGSGGVQKAYAGEVNAQEKTPSGEENANPRATA